MKTKAKEFMSIFFLMLFLGTSSSFAQSQAAQLTAEQKETMQESITAFQDVLSLSSEQKPEFEAITMKYAKQMIAVRDSDDGNFKKYEKVKSIRKKRNAEMKQLLSPDQYEVYLDKQEEMQKKMKAKRG